MTTNAEQIVRALAASYPPVQQTGLGGALKECALCEVQVVSNWGEKFTFDDHKPTCPWRLAVEWVAGREALVDPTASPFEMPKGDIGPLDR